MKTISFLLVLTLISVAARCQVDNAVKAIVKNGIDSFSTTLDSTVKYKRVTTGTTVLNADTLRIPSGTQVLFHFAIDAMNPANGDAAWGQRSVMIENVAGVYKVAGVRNLDGSGFAGERTMAKASWNLIIVSNLPVLRLTGVGTGAINWSIRKTIL